LVSRATWAALAIALWSLPAHAQSAGAPATAPPQSDAAAPNGETSGGGERASWGVQFGVEVGAGRAGGASAPFATGVGRALTVGYFVGNWGLEWRLFERYDAGLAIDDKDAIDGRLGVSSLFLRRVFPITSRVYPEVYLGAARVAAPILVPGSPLETSGRLLSDELRGIGLGFGGGLLVALSNGLLVTAGVRAYAVRWERAGDEAIVDIDDSGATPQGERSIDVDGGLPLTFNLGLRLLL